MTNQMELTVRTPVSVPAQQNTNNNANHLPSLRESIHHAVHNHIAAFGSSNISNLYELVLAEMEQALIERVLDYTAGNESRAAKVLGISRGTLRQRRKNFGHYDRENRIAY